MTKKNILRVKTSLKAIFIFTLIALLSKSTYSQSNIIRSQDLSSVNADNLSDAQVREFIARIQNNGMSLSQMEDYALQRGMKSDQIKKLKKRVNELNDNAEEQNSEKRNKNNIKNLSTKRGKRENENRQDTLYRDKAPKDSIDYIFMTIKPKIFGSEMFNNKNFTFEPNLKIATPINYIIGPEDEIIINIYGYSEANYKLEVNPDGNIIIPYIGPVHISGETIETAKKRITAKLKTIYSGIEKGKTFINVSLGSIRSISVTIVGEAVTPGTYTLPSLATAFNALYAAGGPNEIGSFRNIKVVRQGKVVSTIDLYEFLVNGDQSKNISLKDQDVILINPYSARVELQGEIKRPGLYEALNQESLEDLIRFSGGFTNIAYKNRIKVYRNNGKEKSVTDIPNDIFSFFSPSSGDIYTIDPIMDRFTNRIRIEGAVFRPGIFGLTENMTLAELIKKAEGIKEDAFMNKGTVSRLQSDNSREIIDFNLSDIISGISNIKLKREDSVHIASKFSLREAYTVKIYGEVANPDTYPYMDNMTVSDLIFTAGGFKERGNSKQIEISRRVKIYDGELVTNTLAEVFTVNLDEELNFENDSEKFTLMPFDEVSVHLNPNYNEQRVITIEGEVLRPGKYALAYKTDRISDLIKRAGGFTDYAYPEGAVLIRSLKRAESEKILDERRIEAFKKISADSIRTNQNLEIEEKQESNLVGIDMIHIMKNPKSKYDLFLEDSDIIRIPKELQTVEIKGEVLYSASVRYDRSMSFKDYIYAAGGFSSKALRSRSYVVYPNGKVKSTRRILFIFNSYPYVMPGSQVFVPTKEKKEIRLVEWAGITTSLASLAAVLVTLIRR